MSSPSPPRTPPHGGLVLESRSPVGEPDVERELTPTEAVRERADGEISPPLVQKSLNNGEESTKEKETKTAEDLDKDIDAMLEYNGNGCDDVSIDSIPFDITDSTLSVKTSSFTERVELVVNGKVAYAVQESPEVKTYDPDRREDSEKSFTSISTSNSSILAEAVVNRALTNAVKMAKEGEEAKAVSGDLKVGLFQYQHGGGDAGPEPTDEEDKTLTDSELGDVKVGLFQYFDDSEDNAQQSLDLEIDDNDEKLESLNLSDQENVLRLYGLGGSEVTETRLMTTPPSSPRTEEEKREFFIDVQREIYEPQKRMFSISRDKSSTESTPRDKVSELTSPTAREENEIDNEFKDDAFAESLEGSIPARMSPVEIEEQEGKKSVREDSFLSETQSTKDESLPKDSTSVAIDVGPPLVQYEPLKENGKFRIIKMPKEGNGSTFGTIIVGTGGSPSQSPGESPRETVVKDKGHESTVARTETETLGASQSASKVNQTKADVRIENQHGRTVDVQEQIEKPLNSVSQTLPIVTPSSSTEIEENEKHLLLTQGHLISSYSDSKELPLPSRDVANTHPSSLLKEPVLSRSELMSGSPGRRSGPHGDSRPHLQLLGKQTSPRTDADSRIKYSTTDILGRENKRTGPVPFSLEEYRNIPGKDYSYKSDEPRRHPTPYEAELIESAYKRVTDRTGEPAPMVITSSIETGPIPGYKTLQEQQARWASMFKSLEEQHKRELRTQYERHQYNIHRLQQQMELELQKQHQSIRKKLDIHKEALRRMSPERDSLSPDRGYRSPEREHRSPIGQRMSPVRDVKSSLREQWSPAMAHISPVSDLVSSGIRGQTSFERMTPVRTQSPERLCDRRSRSADGSLERGESKSWREIYQEVRAEEEKREPTPTPPIIRSLEGDFADLEDSVLDRSRTSLSRSALSPRTRDSLKRERVLQGKERISPEQDSISSEWDTYKVQDKLFTQETPEKLRSEDKRESRSRTKKSPQQLSPALALSKEGSEKTSPLRPSSISPHVQELLDNLSEGRSSLRGLQSPPSHIETSGATERPRAGVYSSPMPLLAGKVTKSTQSSKTTLDASSSLDASRSLSYGADRSLRYDTESGRRSRESDLRRLDDSCLSSSSRLSLREKHSKHLADLRSYYEEELRELRRALTESLDSTGTSVDHGSHATIENQLLEAENRHLLDKCRTMEDELEDLYQRIRELEQKGKGLEKRASEYAAAFSDSQSMAVQHRAHIEELQRYCRERDDLVSDLEAKIRSQEDALKIYKKNLEEELELHRQDKSALQRIIDKYESLEREQKLLQETMNTAENKLYEARTEIVELNRTISKLELENKRLGRENDNLRHKVTQSINLTSLHESFGSPPSSRQPDPPSRRQTASPVHFGSQSADLRVPSFTGTPDPRSQSADVSGIKDSSRGDREKTKKSKHSDWKESKQKEQVIDEKNRKKVAETSGPREDFSQRPRSRHQDREPSLERQIRDATPPRPASVASQSESESGDYSPLIKAERELYKLRDMMRQAVAVKRVSSPPPEPVLQKKFYGSERPSSKDEYVPDFGTPRGKKEKQSSSHTSVAKTKSKPNSSHLREERSEKDKSSKKSAASKTDKNSKTKDKVKEKSKCTETPQRTPTKKDQDSSGIAVKADDFNSPTRFDININEDTKTLSVKKVPQSGKQKNLFAESNQSVGDMTLYDQRMQRSHDESTQTNDQDDGMQKTLDRLRAGNYTTRPQWEDVFTSMAKPKPEDEQKVKAMTKEEKIKDRLQNIANMEHRYDELQAEKRQLESSLTKIPIHGRVDRNNRRQKEELEERLDEVEKELGSLRMSLKRCNVLKTVG